MSILSNRLAVIGAAAAVISGSPSAICAAEDPAGGGANGSVDAGAEVAKKLQNPVSSLISIPLENDFDFGGGPSGDRFGYALHVQPVVPVSIGPDWNLISRTIVTYIDQAHAVGQGRQSGLGDTTESLFLSPKSPTRDGWIWGAGTVLLLPTATEDRLGTRKWGAGPTFVVLKQANGWTYGALVNQVWSFAGPSARENVSATLLQPFLNYTTRSLTTFGVGTESSYDWQRRQWTVPVNATVSQLVKIAGRPISLLAGVRYYADRPEGGPRWGLRTTVTLLLPR